MPYFAVGIAAHGWVFYMYDIASNWRRIINPLPTASTF